MSAKDGGPAFPSENARGETRGGVTELVPCAGMSLRDYFAGQAMAGILGSEGSVELSRRSQIALECFLIADAMILEREK